MLIRYNLRPICKETHYANHCKIGQVHRCGESCIKTASQFCLICHLFNKCEGKKSTVERIVGLNTYSYKYLVTIQPSSLKTDSNNFCWFHSWATLVTFGTDAKLITGKHGFLVSVPSLLPCSKPGAINKNAKLCSIWLAPTGANYATKIIRQKT